MTKFKLGEGVLTWDGSERRSDRYGTVYLIQEGHNSFTLEPSHSLINEATAHNLKGRKGSLVAVVKETRESTHIGDLFRGIYPSTPEVGEIIELGQGTLFAESLGHAPGWNVGLRPDDGRGDDWLDPLKLYRAHEQTVELFFHPAD